VQLKTSKNTRLTLYEERLNLLKELKSTTDGGRLFHIEAFVARKRSYGNY